MRLHRQIKACLFLIIISIFNAHNALPHVHHQHNDDQAHHAELKSHDHHHHGQHHHHSEDGNNHEQHGLFDFLFKNHSHSAHTHQHVRTAVTPVKPTKDYGIDSMPACNLLNEAPGSNDPGRHKYVLFKNSPPDKHCEQSDPYRGPPALV